MQLHLITSGPEITQLALTGRLDAGAVQEINERFTDLALREPKNVILDFSGVSFMASMGIRMLVSAAKTLARTGHKLILLAPQELVREVIDLAAIDEIIPVASDKAQALSIARDS